MKAKNICTNSLLFRSREEEEEEGEESESTIKTRDRVCVCVCIGIFYCDMIENNIATFVEREARAVQNAVTSTRAKGRKRIDHSLPVWSLNSSGTLA